MHVDNVELGRWWAAAGRERAAQVTAVQCTGPPAPRTVSPQPTLSRAQIAPARTRAEQGAHSIATAKPSSYFCFSPRVGRESMEHNWENAEFCPLLAVCSPCWPDGTRPPVCLVMRGRQCQRENNGAACRHYRTAATEFIALSKVLTGCKE